MNINKEHYGLRKDFTKPFGHMYNIGTDVEGVSSENNVNEMLNKYLSTRCCQIFVNKASYDFLEPTSTQQIIGESRGSGFVVDFGELGLHIVTNHHVVADFLNIKVSFPVFGERKLIAKLASWCPESDIAFLKVQDESYSSKIESVDLGSSESLNRGDKLLAVGYPLGMTNIQFQNGNLTGYHDNRFERYLQHSCLLNPGNSGGACFQVKSDNKIEVVGVNNAIIKEAQGIDFSIPIERVKILINEYKSKVKEANMEGSFRINKIDFGAFCQPLDANIKGYKNYKGTGGIYIANVMEGSIADNHGLKRGDIITHIDGNEIDDIGQMNVTWCVDKTNMYNMINRKSFGDTVSANIFRSGKMMTKDIKLDDTNPYKVKMLFAPICSKPDSIVVAGHVFCDLSMNVIGQLQQLNPKLTQYMFNENRLESAVVCTKLIPGLECTSNNSTIIPGNILTKIGDTEIKSVKDVRSYFSNNRANEYHVFRTDFGYDLVLSSNEIKNEDTELCETIRPNMKKDPLLQALGSDEIEKVSADISNLSYTEAHSKYETLQDIDENLTTMHELNDINNIDYDSDTSKGTSEGTSDDEKCVHNEHMHRCLHCVGIDNEKVFDEEKKTEMDDDDANFMIELENELNNNDLSITKTSAENSLDNIDFVESSNVSELDLGELDNLKDPVIDNEDLT